MSLKQRICQTFCSSVEATHFNGGWAVSTPYTNHLGDRIGVYVIGPDGGPYRIIDTALTVAYLEAEGATLDSETRRRAFHTMLDQYGASFDDELGELFIDSVPDTDLPRKILDFSALLLRMNDMLLMTEDRVRSTFRDDVKRALISELAGKATIREDEPPYAELSDVIPDLVAQADGRDPVAIFIATNESKLWQAMHLRMTADYEARKPLQVVAILETDSSATGKVRAQADNRLDAVPRYQGDAKQAIQRVVTEVVGRSSSVH